MKNNKHEKVQMMEINQNTWKHAGNNVFAFRNINFTVYLD